MSNIFGYNEETMSDRMMTFTPKEIARQPRTWKTIYEKILNRKKDITNFIEKLDGETRIIFTGAGSSGFIGDSLAPTIRRDFKFRSVESIHTTDLVSAPEQYLVKDIKTVLISFGRSGDSPESIAAIDVANKAVDDIYHIIITCNPKGKLASYTSNNTLNLVLDEIEDQGFAMTSSVTGMMLAAYSILNIDTNLQETVELLSNYAEAIIKNKYELIRNAYDNKVSRLVVLGSGNLFGVARESALKSIELTAGKIVGIYDTPMGFRHGPKSMLNDKTIILFYVSEDKYTQQYDLDMIKELSQSEKYKLIAVSDMYIGEVEENSDLYLYNSKDKSLGQEFLPFTSLIIAQILALFASVSLGCTPDNPFPSGEVNRVVKGVSIHNL